MVLEFIVVVMLVAVVSSGMIILSAYDRRDSKPVAVAEYDLAQHQLMLAEAECQDWAIDNCNEFETDPQGYPLTIENWVVCAIIAEAICREESNLPSLPIMEEFGLRDGEETRFPPLGI
jgi:hypothetical protein